VEHHQARHHEGSAASAGHLADSAEQALSHVRALVEHPFHIVNNRFRHKKLCHRSFRKNTAQLYKLFALANLVVVKQALLARLGG
jgi:IS5 family transposase